MKSKLNYVLMFIAIFIFLIGIFIENITTILIGVLILWLSNIVYSLFDFKNRIVFLMFNATFFIFLLGRITVTGIFKYKEGYTGLLGTAFNDYEVIYTMLLVLFLSLLFLYIGYQFFEMIKKNKKNQAVNLSENEQQYRTTLRGWSKFIFLTSILLKYIYIVEMINVSTTQGYYESFAVFKSSLPTIIVIYSNFFEIAFFALLATLPSKKESIPYIGLYLLEGILMLLSGRRSEIMLNLLIVFIYIIFRHSLNSNEKWLKKKYVVYIAALVPIMLILLTSVEAIRGNKSDINTSLLEKIQEFFYSQGISVNLIGYSKVFKHTILQNNNYTFGPVIEFYLTKISREYAFFGQTVDRAVNGHLFSHTISYLIMPDLYLRGVGYGSSFLAEMYSDFTYVGVVVGSFVYGLLLNIINRLYYYKNVLFVTLAFMITRELLFTPRATTLYFLVNVFSPTKILGEGVVFFGAYILFKSLKSK